MGADATDKEGTSMDTYAPDEKDNTEEKAGTSSGTNNGDSTDTEETDEQKELRSKHHTEDDLKLLRELRRFRKQMQEQEQD